MIMSEGMANGDHNGDHQISNNNNNNNKSSPFSLNLKVGKSSKVIPDRLVNDPSTPEDFVYEDRDHFSSLLEKLNTLRKNKQFCDVILQVGNQQDVQEFYAHKTILGSASSYFLDFFATESVNHVGLSSAPHVYKMLGGNFDLEAFEYLLEFIYTARLEVPPDKVKSVYALANRLKMSGIAHHCGQYLASSLTPETCLAVRSIPGVLSDPILLNPVDAYIRQNIGQVSQSKYIEGLPKVQMIILQNSEEEREATNEKHLFNMVMEWIKKGFDAPDFAANLEFLLEKQHMLYLNKLDRSLHDCNDIDSGDCNYSDAIHDYKALSRRLSAPKKSLTPDPFTSGSGNSGRNDSSGNTNDRQQPIKPRQFLFTRSDSDSSLSSIADDDENDWKVISAHTASKHTIIGLMTIGGKLCAVSVKLRVNSPHSSPGASRGASLEKNVDCYSSIDTMAYARCGMGVADLNGKLVACGGYDRGECLRSAEIYDPESNKWTEMGSMLVPRGRFDVAVLNGSIYAVGGSDGQNELCSAEYYHGESGSWKTLPNSPVVRSNCGVCSLNGKIYIIGGWNGKRGLQRCDVFDPITQEWLSVANLLSGRYQVGVGVLNNEIYAVGGCDQWTCLNTVEKYSTESDAWKKCPPMSSSRRGCGVAAYNGKIYAVGGHDGVYSLCTVEIFDPETGTWSQGPSLTSCRANVGLVVVGGRLYAVGGFTGKIFLNTVEYLDEKNSEWTTFIPKSEKLEELESGINNKSKSGNFLEVVNGDPNIRQSNSKNSVMSDEPLHEVEGEQ